jgi:hypothetical protein
MEDEEEELVRARKDARLREQTEKCWQDGIDRETQSNWEILQEVENLRMRYRKSEPNGSFREDMQKNLTCLGGNSWEDVMPKGGVRDKTLR